MKAITEPKHNTHSEYDVHLRAESQQKLARCLRCRSGQVSQRGATFLASVLHSSIQKLGWHVIGGWTFLTELLLCRLVSDFHAKLVDIEDCYYLYNPCTC